MHSLFILRLRELVQSSLILRVDCKVHYEGIRYAIFRHHKFRWEYEKGITLLLDRMQKLKVWRRFGKLQGRT